MNWLVVGIDFIFNFSLHSPNWFFDFSVALIIILTSFWHGCVVKEVKILLDNNFGSHRRPALLASMTATTALNSLSRLHQLLLLLPVLFPKITVSMPVQMRMMTMEVRQLIRMEYQTWLWSNVPIVVIWTPNAAVSLISQPLLVKANLRWEHAGSAALVSRNISRLVMVIMSTCVQKAMWLGLAAIALRDTEAAKSTGIVSKHSDLPHTRISRGYQKVIPRGCTIGIKIFIDSLLAPVSCYFIGLYFSVSFYYCFYAYV